MSNEEEHTTLSEKTPQQQSQNSSVVGKWKNKIKKFPLRKIHLDYVAGILTIPVLITAIIINYNNLLKSKTNITPTPTPQATVAPESTRSFQPRRIRADQGVTPAACQKSIGPISITSPTEGQTTSDNPVCIDIDYSDTDYCSVVWSYRINGGSWSDYNTDTPCLYNPPNGNIQFQLQVNSTASNDTTTLTRNFVYNGNNVVNTPTPTSAPTPTAAPTSAPAASSSATTN